MRAFYRLSNYGHWSLVIGHWSLVIGHWSLVIGHWSLVIRHSSFVIRHWLFDYTGIKDKGQRTKDKGQRTKDKGQRTKDKGHLYRLPITQLSRFVKQGRDFNLAGEYFLVGHEVEEFLEVVHILGGEFVKHGVGG